MRTWVKYAAPILVLAGAMAGYAGWYGTSTAVYDKFRDNRHNATTPLVLFKLGMNETSVDGPVLNQYRDITITSVVIEITIVESRKCCEKLVNQLSDMDFEGNCKENKDYIVSDVVNEEVHECFRGILGPYNQAICHANTLMKLRDPKQCWGFEVIKIMGRPVDPFSIFES